MSRKLDPDQLAMLDLDGRAYDEAFPAWGGDRRRGDWRIALAKKRGTAATRKAAMALQAPLAPPPWCAALHKTQCAQLNGGRCLCKANALARARALVREPD